MLGVGVSGQEVGALGVNHGEGFWSRGNGGMEEGELCDWKGWYDRLGELRKRRVNAWKKTIEEKN